MIAINLHAAYMLRPHVAIYAFRTNDILDVLPYNMKTSRHHQLSSSMARHSFPIVISHHAQVPQSQIHLRSRPAPGTSAVFVCLRLLRSFPQRNGTE